MSLLQEMTFCGTNRQRCLHRLLDAFHEVHSGIDYPDNAASGRVVVLSAEPGLGKTRLVAELYKELQSTLDNEKYWPETCHSSEGNNIVMPDSSQCNYDARLPFFWWSISVPDVTNGNSVMESLERALPHLTTLEYARRRDASGKSLFREVVDSASDVGLDLADISIDIAGDAIGLGLVKRVGNSVLKIGKTLYSHAGPENLPIDEATERVDSVVDSILLNLEAMLDSSSKRFASRPAVIFIDDAQFSRNDRAVNKFVETIIARMSQQKWPLLLIIAHWKRDLHITMDQNDLIVEKSPMAEVIEHALHGKELGRWAGQIGSTLDDDRFMLLDLSEPIEDLSKAITSWFPDFSSEVVAMINRKAAGNPRKLEQILRTVQETPSWFTDPRLPARLSETGIQEVSDLSQLPIDEIALGRLQNTPADVRDGVVRASLIGFRFIVAILEKLNSESQAQKIRTSLELAEERYAFVTNILDRTKDDLGQFTEGSFLEAARQYVVKGLAYRDLIDWPGEEILNEKLDKILIEILEDPTASEEFTIDDLSFVYGFSADRLKAKGHFAGLALGKKVQVDNQRRDFENAGEASRQFVNGLGDLWFVDSIPFELGQYIGTTLIKIGILDAAEKVFSAYEKLFRDELSANTLQMSVVLTYLGIIQKSQGRLNEAYYSHKQSLEINEKIDNRIAMPANYGNLGIIYKKQGKLKDARAMFTLSLELNAEVGREDGMAKQYGNLGILDLWENRLVDAKINIEEALRIDERLGDELGVASNYCCLGGIYKAQGNLVKAVEFYEMALNIEEEHVHKVGMADCYSGLGLVHKALSEFENAEKEFGKSLKIVTELGDRIRMGNEHCNLGNVQLAIDKPRDARVLFEGALELYGRVKYKVGEANVYSNLGNVYFTIAREALSTLQALDENPQAKIVDHEGKELQQSELRGLKNREAGSALVNAQAYHLKALRLHETLDLKKDLMVDCWNLGSVFQTSGQNGNARKMWQAALKFASSKEQIQQIQNLLASLDD